MIILDIWVDKTVEYIFRNYWFPKMKEKVKNHIENCLKCVVFSPDKGRTEGVLYNIPKKDEPFDTIHVDHCGPFAISGINRFLLVVIDGFSKFVKLYATNKTDSVGVIKKLSNYFENYSRPRRIISDRGSCFTSEMFKEYLSVNNIEQVLVATGSPQANGQVERINRIFTPMCAKLANEKAWHSTLGDVEHVMNNSVHT